MERIITKSFARLMGRGVHRGFITHEELSKSLGKRNLSGQNLEQAFIHYFSQNMCSDNQNVMYQGTCQLAARGPVLARAVNRQPGYRPEDS